MLGLHLHRFHGQSACLLAHFSKVIKKQVAMEHYPSCNMCICVLCKNLCTCHYSLYPPETKWHSDNRNKERIFLQIFLGFCLAAYPDAIGNVTSDHENQCPVIWSQFQQGWDRGANYHLAKAERRLAEEVDLSFIEHVLPTWFHQYDCGFRLDNLKKGLG